MNVEQRQAAADLQTKPSDMAVSPPVGSSKTTIAIYYYYSTRRLILIYRPTEGRRLSWPVKYSNCKLFLLYMTQHATTTIVAWLYAFPVVSSDLL